MTYDQAKQQYAGTVCYGVEVCGRVKSCSPVTTQHLWLTVLIGRARSAYRMLFPDELNQGSQHHSTHCQHTTACLQPADRNRQELMLLEALLSNLDNLDTLGLSPMVLSA